MRLRRKLLQVGQALDPSTRIAEIPTLLELNLLQDAVGAALWRVFFAPAELALPARTADPVPVIAGSHFEIPFTVTNLRVNDSLRVDVDLERLASATNGGLSVAEPSAVVAPGQRWIIRLSGRLDTPGPVRIRVPLRARAGWLRRSWPFEPEIPIHVWRTYWTGPLAPEAPPGPTRTLTIAAPLEVGSVSELFCHALGVGIPVGEFAAVMPALQFTKAVGGEGPARVIKAQWSTGALRRYETTHVRLILVSERPLPAVEWLDLAGRIQWGCKEER